MPKEKQLKIQQENMPYTSLDTEKDKNKTIRQKGKDQTPPNVF